ncbi:MAG TPA: ATP-dependent DNA ligase [Actinomycetota bacterium]|nr:ATP-dependent DNA ligase [Actinomycetota bacterium]
MASRHDTMIDVDTVPPPPIAPMLARLERVLPEGPYFYEPKWDGFRCLAFASPSGVVLTSRNLRPLGRYFPELVDALAALGTAVVLDGEIVVEGRDGPDFEALLQRLHPAASRVERLARETPACFVAFDVLGAGRDDLRTQPFARRRPALERILHGVAPPVLPTPATRDARVARRWLDGGSAGVDGVMAKDERLPYLPGARALVKVKRERTAECVVAGFRWHRDEPVVGSLLLGVWTGDALRHVGLVTGLRASLRHELLDDVRPLVADVAGHPWERGFALAGGPVGRLPGVASRWADGGSLTWVPLRPERVCEVAYDHFDAGRFRHPPRWRRWRPDRDPASCTLEQFSG